MKLEKLLQVQKEIQPIIKDKKNPFFKSNYADINNMLEVVKPILSKHGIILLQPTTATGLKTLLIDAETGENLAESEIAIPQDNDPQKMGSKITYYRRYALQSLLALEAEDDDGNTASGKTETRSKYSDNKADDILADIM